MSNWIKTEHELPEEDCFCMVSREPYAAVWQATYDAKEKMFSLIDPGSNNGFVPVDVTHYVVLPVQPWYDTEDKG